MARVSANEKSYLGIREKLESGKLAPGDKLVTRQLAAEFGVSLSPVREAIGRLATEGLVEHAPGVGARVRRITLVHLNELYLLRDAIESCAAGLAATNMSDMEFEELEFCVDGQMEIAGEVDQSKSGVATRKQLARWLQLEERYHETIIGAARNQLLSEVIQKHRAIAKVFGAQHQEASLLTSELALATARGKQEMLELFRKRDSNGARALMSKQIDIGRKTVINHFRKNALK